MDDDALTRGNNKRLKRLPVLLPEQADKVKRCAAKLAEKGWAFDKITGDILFSQFPSEVGFIPLCDKTSTTAHINNALSFIGTYNVLRLELELAT